MRRHPFNFLSFVLGAWLMLAGAFVTSVAIDSYRDVVWLGPSLLIGLGVVVFVGAVRSVIGKRNAEDRDV